MSFLGASNPFVKFLHRLEFAKLKVVDGQQILLVNMSVGGVQAAGNKIIIRNSWTDLFRCASNSLTAAAAQHHKVLFLGKSGCGNSWFAYYWIWMLLCMDQKILYHIHDSLYLISRGTVEVISTRDLHHLDADIWYLSDPKPGQDPISPCSWKTIFFCSLGINPYHSYRKTYALTLYIPCWTWPEIYFLGIHCSTVSPERIKTITSEWGNVPRCVVSNTNESLKHECAKIESMPSMLKSILSAKVIDDTFPFSLLQLQPSQHYDKLIFNFASQRIQDLVFLELIRSNRSSLQDFLVQEQRPCFALLRYQLFETFTHYWLRKAESCKLSRLQSTCCPGSDFEISQPSARHLETLETIRFDFHGYIRETRSFRYVPKETIRSGKYIRTAVKTGDFFDSFAYSNGCIFFFSILLHETDSLDSEQIKSLSLQVVHKLGNVPIRFVFVLPTFVRNGANRMVPRIRSVNDAGERTASTSSRSADGGWSEVEVNQFVLEIDVMSEIQRLDCVYVRR
eukprot:763767-Hanusia_phi.AAC.3